MNLESVIEGLRAALAKQLREDPAMFDEGIQPPVIAADPIFWSDVCDVMGQPQGGLPEEFLGCQCVVAKDRVVVVTRDGVTIEVVALV